MALRLSLNRGMCARLAGDGAARRYSMARCYRLPCVVAHTHAPVYAATVLHCGYRAGSSRPMDGNAGASAAAVLLRQRGSALPSPSIPTEDVIPLDTVDDVRTAFRCSVEARTVSNLQLRRYVQGLLGKDYALGEAAVTGAKDGGLRVTADVYEALLSLLIEGGQLHASMELYQRMTTVEHMTPTPKMYAQLMELCLQRDSPSACQRLFRDMHTRGMRPSAHNYSLLLDSLAAENPPKWEEAIAVFDRLTKERKSQVNARTYNALMRVYMNMQPFDWRVVYNCYHDMRSREPRIKLEWESYLILKEALRLGKAGYVRRFMAYLDAWIQTTPLWSMDFMKGVLVYFTVLWVIKTIAGYILALYWRRGGADGESHLMAESILPPT